MDNSMSMGVLQRAQDLGCNPDAVVQRELPLALEPLPKGGALDVRHGVPQLSGGNARLEQRQDVGMLQARGGADFLLETLGPERSRQLGVQHLQRNPPPERTVLRQ